MNLIENDTPPTPVPVSHPTPSETPVHTVHGGDTCGAIKNMKTQDTRIEMADRTYRARGAQIFHTVQ